MKNIVFLYWHTRKNRAKRWPLKATDTKQNALQNFESNVTISSYKQFFLIKKEYRGTSYMCFVWMMREVEKKRNGDERSRREVRMSGNE